jgi:glutamate formiminotransferase
VLECVVNLSEGRDAALLDAAAEAAGTAILDVHRDPDHHRAVLTMAGPAPELAAAVRSVATWAVSTLSLENHHGAHPRIGVLDVVPWVDLDDPTAEATAASLEVRNTFAAWAGTELALPCFVYGPERTLPDIRRHAWDGLRPDTGPPAPHPTAGACAVGARGVLVAYNLWLSTPDVRLARRVAGAIRRPGLRALGLQVGTRVQVSCNLTEPARLGPGAAYDLVAAHCDVAAAELVGLLPRSVLDAVPGRRWTRLGLAADRTIEGHLGMRGWQI